MQFLFGAAPFARSLSSSHSQVYSSPSFFLYLSLFRSLRLSLSWNWTKRQLCRVSAPKTGENIFEPLRFGIKTRPTGGWFRCSRAGLIGPQLQGIRLREKEREAVGGGAHQQQRVILVSGIWRFFSRWGGEQHKTMNRWFQHEKLDRLIISIAATHNNNNRR